ncbi:hypothetical protein PHO31112_05185 [Pandoraea horticolens]|uniref:DUF485 domain-containing protein n=1 Tax=Pandoraea horticolens TaxID=2508298 RepID=A0A5E4Z7U8_9BURK|nr:DUF485 domain-containing protein [Pandoraea horticolens]VVE57361.1 hypothetical protein PHO31112_05185 [Pandoraea horticolens]
MDAHIRLSEPIAPPSTAEFQPGTFEACVASKSRLIIRLTAAFFVWYFALLIGDGWFRSQFATPIAGMVNVGMVLTLSQYLFGAGLAIFYAWRMRTIDAQIAAATAAGPEGAQR